MKEQNPESHLPRLTDEQRDEALRMAARARQERARLKDDLRKGLVTAEQALELPAAQKLTVRAFLLSIPGVGEKKACRLMRAAHVSDRRRIRGLGCRQRAALLEMLRR